MAKCESCEHKDWRIRELLEDLENLRSQNESHLRTQAALRAELTRRAERSPQAQKVNDVLEYWRETTAARREDVRAVRARQRAAIAPDTERYKITKRALNWFGDKQLKWAIENSAKSKWHMRGNSDGKILDDIKHLFRKESVIEELLELGRDHPGTAQGARPGPVTKAEQGAGRRASTPSPVASSPDPVSFYGTVASIWFPDSGATEHAVRCLNPEHDDRHASMSINTKTGAFNCHACSAKGGPYDAALLVGYRPNEAMELIEQFGLKNNGSGPMPTKKRRPMVSESRILSWVNELQADEKVLTYLKNRRCWTPEALKQLDVGKDGHRLTIPVRDAHGKLQGILRYDPTGRTKPKLQAERGTERGLFPAPEIFRMKDKPLYLLEGEPDAITARSIGLNAVAIPGVEGWRDEWADRFEGFEVKMIFDCDDPGRTTGLSIAAKMFWEMIDLAPDRNDGYDFTDAVRDGWRP